MERSEILELMAALGLSGMRAAYDEIVTVGIKRQHGVEKVIGALLKAEISAKQARSINYHAHRHVGLTPHRHVNGNAAAVTTLPRTP
jgi:hypothetical protein